jgi:hypothetical protein
MLLPKPIAMKTCGQNSTTGNPAGGATVPPISGGEVGIPQVRISQGFWHTL